MPVVAVEDGAIFYQVAGHGDAVVFVSGLGGEAAFWREQLTAFAGSYRVIAYDHRGVGGSTGAPPYTVAQWSDDLLAVLDHARIERAHLVAHSTGGIIAQAVAAAHPARILTLSLGGTWMAPDQRFRDLFVLRKNVLLQMGENAYRLLGIMVASPGPRVSDAPGLLPMLQDARDVILGRIDALLAYDGTANVSRIENPMLVLASRDDYIVPSYLSRAIAEASGAQMTMFEDGGHFFPQTRASDYNRTLSEFWKKVGMR